MSAGVESDPVTSVLPLHPYRLYLGHLQPHGLFCATDEVPSSPFSFWAMLPIIITDKDINWSVSHTFAHTMRIHIHACACSFLRAKSQDPECCTLNYLFKSYLHGTTWYYLLATTPAQTLSAEWKVRLEKASDCNWAFMVYLTQKPRSPTHTQNDASHCNPAVAHSFLIHEQGGTLLWTTGLLFGQKAGKLLNWRDKDKITF